MQHQNHLVARDCVYYTKNWKKNIKIKNTVKYINLNLDVYSLYKYIGQGKSTNIVLVY